jgi:hypothetical protein
MSDTTAARNKRFTFVMTEAEHARLMALAEDDRRSAGDWLRLIVDREHRARFGSAKKRRAKRPNK